ncbi:MAG: phosphatidate cytidylyltransferase [Oscillospiraceae bacterium]|nr:phosphatidate cytidylyltransferase [Oscillospiraceae bacterium]
MKARVITALVGLGVLAVVLCFYQTLVFNIAVGVVAALAAQEAAGAVGLAKHKVLVVESMLFALLVPVATQFWGMVAVGAMALLYIILVFVEVIRNHAELDIANVGLLVMIVVGVTLSLNCVVLIRNATPIMWAGLYYSFLIFASAWLCDIGGYFVGSAFGKHRLAPVISPKKSVEGLYGGLATAVVGNLLIALLFATLYNRGIVYGHLSYVWNINYLYVALVTPVLALLGVLGDLSASIVKRRFGIKDFGAIFPGHGGILDRFDSLLFIAPMVYLMLRYLPVL